MDSDTGFKWSQCLHLTVRTVCQLQPSSLSWVLNLILKTNPDKILPCIGMRVDGAGDISQSGPIGLPSWSQAASDSLHMVKPHGPLSVLMSGQVACSQETTTRAADIARVPVHFSLVQLQHPSTVLSVQLPIVPWMSVLAETPLTDNLRFQFQRAWRIRGLSLLTSSSCQFTEYLCSPNYPPTREDPLCQEFLTHLSISACQHPTLSQMLQLLSARGSPHAPIMPTFRVISPSLIASP